MESGSLDFLSFNARHDFDDQYKKDKRILFSPPQRAPVIFYFETTCFFFFLRTREKKKTGRGMPYTGAGRGEFL